MSEIHSRIDHTLLKPEATSKEIERLCKEAIEFSFKAVCVNPIHVPLVHRLLLNKEICACTVVGFPLGATSKELKQAETIQSLNNGADEIDMVINIGALIEGNLNLVKEDIKAVLAPVREKNKILKVIIETSKLNAEHIACVCKICNELEVDFVKTSTGFGGDGAKVEDIKLMRETLLPHIKIKASGGIKTLADAKKMIAAGADRIGTSSGVTICS